MAAQYRRLGSLNALTRFWKKVGVRDGGCWLWRGSCYPNGYGQFAMRTERGRGNRMQAHRVVWQIVNGVDLPPEIQVCHSCDTPRCCNPAHLFLGSQQDNMNDMAAKGRAHWQGAERDVNGKFLPA